MVILGMLHSFIASVEDFWIWHILLQRGINLAYKDGHRDVMKKVMWPAGGQKNNKRHYNA